MFSSLVPVALATLAALLPSAVVADSAAPLTSNPNNYPPVIPGRFSGSSLDAVQSQIVTDTYFYYSLGVYNLDPKWNTGAKPTTRVYNWEVNYAFGCSYSFAQSSLRGS